MNLIATIALTASLLGHALMGCCMHHGHSSAAGCCEETASGSATHACHGHTHHVGDDDSHCEPNGEHPRNPGPHQCDGAACNFARTDSSPDNQPLTLLGYLSFLPQITGPSHLCATDLLSLRHAPPPGQGPAALRLHLVLGVMLN